MKTSPDPLREEVGAALAADMAAGIETEDAGAGDHPDPDELIAYHAGRLPESAAEEIQEHLLVCRPCLDDLLDLESFVEAPRSASAQAIEAGAVGFESASAWRALRPRLAPRRRSIPMAAWVAALLVAALGLGLWGWHQSTAVKSLRHELALLGQPAGALIADLSPASSSRGSSAAPAPIPLAPEDRYLALILTLPEKPDFERFEAALVDAAQRELWRGELRMGEYGTLSLGLPSRFLAPGEYSIVLYGVDGPSRQRLEAFALHLVPAGGP